MTLAELKPGESFTIIRITLTREIGKRLADMGFVRGTGGQVVRVAHFGDPIEVEIRGNHISLRKNEAQGIEIENSKKNNSLLTGISIVLLAISLIVMSHVTYLSAAHPYNTDDVGVVSDRSFEIEASGGTDLLTNADGGLAIKYGTGDRFDIGISCGAVLPTDRARTLTPPTIGMKFAILPNRFALSAATELAEQDFSLSAILSGGFRNTALNANIGVSATEEELLIYAGSIQQIVGPWTIGGELFGNHRHTPLWQLGVAHSFNAPISTSVGLGGSFTSPDELTTTLAVTISLQPGEINEKEAHHE